MEGLFLRRSGNRGGKLSVIFFPGFAGYASTRAVALQGAI
ncbi:hypothetical protein LMG28690_01383 [Paraburkholderia caffeinilytica]|nr:hypothetical protein LMG28690_01383 [Paraburkholderia caffeinilytica]